MIDRVAERLPLGGLERFLADPEVSEVMVNAGSQVWVERRGVVEHVGQVSTEVLLGAIERILAPLGRRVDRLSPTVDARLADGSRVCAVLPPVAVDGPCLAIRRFTERTLDLDAFAPPHTVRLLESIVEHRCNVLVSGATSTGKTTLLNALASRVPATERIILLEDTAELRLTHPHVLRLESRDATPDGVGAVTLDHLLRTALRLRPDRLVLGEVRSDEAVALVQAMNTGHDGSLSTIHANSATDALRRLRSLVSAAAPAWPAAVVAELVHAALDIVVHLTRDGTRRYVSEVIELAATPECAPRELISADPTKPGPAHRQPIEHASSDMRNTITSGEPTSTGDHSPLPTLTRSRR